MLPLSHCRHRQHAAHRLRVMVDPELQRLQPPGESDSVPSQAHGPDRPSVHELQPCRQAVRRRRRRNPQGPAHRGSRPHRRRARGNEGRPVCLQPLLPRRGERRSERVDAGFRRPREARHRRRALRRSAHRRPGHVRRAHERSRGPHESRRSPSKSSKSTTTAPRSPGTSCSKRSPFDPRRFGASSFTWASSRCRTSSFG